MSAVLYAIEHPEMSREELRINTGLATEEEKRAAWLEERKGYLGGTDIAAIVAAHPYRSAFLVYNEKLGLAEPQPETAAMRRGTKMEPYLAEFYADHTGRRIEKAPTYRMPEKPYLGVNPDYTARTEVGTVERLVELKTHNVFMADGYGPEGTDEVPEHEVIQCTWEMHLTGCHVCDLVVLFGLDDMRVYTLTYDPDLGQMLEEAADAFWTDHVLAQVPPPLSGHDAEGEWLKRRYPSDAGTIAYATPEIDALCQQLRGARDTRKKAEATEDEIALRIKAFMAEASILSSSAGQFSWKQAKDSEVTDWKAIAVALGAPAELIQQHTTIKPGSRRFLTPKEWR